MAKIALYEKIKHNGYYFCLNCRSEFPGSTYREFKSVCPVCKTICGIDYVELNDVIRLNKKEIVGALESIFNDNLVAENT